MKNPSPPRGPPAWPSRAALSAADTLSKAIAHANAMQEESGAWSRLRGGISRRVGAYELGCEGTCRTGRGSRKGEKRPCLHVEGPEARRELERQQRPYGVCHARPHGSAGWQRCDREGSDVAEEVREAEGGFTRIGPGRPAPYGLYGERPLCPEGAGFIKGGPWWTKPCPGFVRARTETAASG